MLPLIGKNATSFGFCQKQDHEVVIVEAVAIQERDESTCCLAMHWVKGTHPCWAGTAAGGIQFAQLQQG